MKYPFIQLRYVLFFCFRSEFIYELRYTGREREVLVQLIYLKNGKRNVFFIIKYDQVHNVTVYHTLTVINVHE